jgi:hypothetical protein
MLSFGDSLPDDDDGRVDTAFEAGTGDAEAANRRSSRSSSSEKSSRRTICLAGFSFPPRVAFLLLERMLSSLLFLRLMLFSLRSELALASAVAGEDVVYLSSVLRGKGGGGAGLGSI